MKVGILSLQGSFFDHQKSLDLISLESLLVKTPEDLDKVDGIILPGGESTAMSKISSYNNLYKKLDTKIKQGLPTLSTCAGTIILSKSVIDGDTHIPNIDIEIQRNAYGRQNESFEADVNFLNNTYSFDSSILKIIFIGLASLTFPHILLEYLLEKNEKQRN